MYREEQITNIGKSRGVMGMMDISTSGMVAQSQRMLMLAKYAADVNSIHKKGQYQHNKVTFQENLARAQKGVESNQGGVIARSSDNSLATERIYDPSNPVADSEGFIYRPKHSFSKLMTDWSIANKHFDANLNLYKVEQQMAQQILDMGR